MIFSNFGKNCYEEPKEPAIKLLEYEEARNDMQIECYIHPKRDNITEESIQDEIIVKMIDEMNREGWYHDFMDFLIDFNRKLVDHEDFPGIFSELLGRQGSRRFSINETEIRDIFQEDHELNFMAKTIMKSANLVELYGFRNRFSKKAIIRFIYCPIVDEGFHET